MNTYRQIEQAKRIATGMGIGLSELHVNKEAYEDAMERVTRRGGSGDVPMVKGVRLVHNPKLDAASGPCVQWPPAVGRKIMQRTPA